VGWGGVGYDWI